MRGCIDANILNPSAYAQSFFESSYEEEITYTIEKKLDSHQYRLKVCRIVDDGDISGYGISWVRSF